MPQVVISSVNWGFHVDVRGKHSSARGGVSAVKLVFALRCDGGPGFRVSKQAGMTVSKPDATAARKNTIGPKLFSQDFRSLFLHEGIVIHPMFRRCRCISFSRDSFRSSSHTKKPGCNATVSGSHGISRCFGVFNGFFGLRCQC